VTKSVTGGGERELAEVEFFNAPLNGAAVDPEKRLIAFLAAEQLFPRSASSHSGGGALPLVESPDGKWRVAHYLSDLAEEGAWHRSRLMVERMDGAASAVAVDEYVPHAICGVDMEVLGWTAAGELLYARAACGEGCVRFPGPDVPRLLDPATGESRPLESIGTHFAISPDGKMIASLRSDSEGRLELVLESLATGELRTYLVPEVPPPALVEENDVPWSAIDIPLWSPDSQRLAVTQVFGRCPEEDASRITMIDVASLEQLAMDESVGDPWVATAWLDEDRLELRPLDARGDTVGGATRVLRARQTI
jgi:hypothetical protein